MNADATVSRLIKNNSRPAQSVGYDGYTSVLAHLNSPENAKRRAAGCIWSARLIIQHPDKQYALKSHRMYMAKAAEFREMVMRVGK